ncbi:hypothetical protein DL93DRAFT_2090957 [Clavulina sp. PMI_390]|nr:hypothetical protein DL93DRAFT_2090957 [Clavulina sp. PMI_390]
MAATKPVVPSRPLPAPPPSPISASSPPLSLPSLSIITHPPAPSISDAPSTSTTRRPPPPLLSPLSGSSSMSRRSSIADTPRSSTSSMAPPSTPLGPPPSLPLPDLPPFPSPIDPKIALSLANVSRGGGIRSIDPSRPSLSRRVSEGLVSLSSIPPSPTTSVRSKADSFSHTNPGNNATLPRRLPSSASLSVSGSTGRHRSGRAPRPISTASAWSVASANSQMSYISAASEALGQSMAELDREAEEMGILLPSSSSGYASASGGSGSERERLSKSLGPSSGRSSRRSSRSHHNHHAHARPSMPPTSYSSSYLQQQQQPSSVPPLSAPPAISESPYHQQHLPQPPPLSPTSSASSSAHPHSLRSTASAPLLATTLRKVSLRSLYPPTPTGAADLPSPREDDEISGSVNSPNQPCRILCELTSITPLTGMSPASLEALLVPPPMEC